MTLIKSMTGYGRAVKTLLGREFTVELRAVNNRYLDCTVKLPRSLTFAEEGVKQRVKAAVARGKVDVLISVGAAAGRTGPGQPEPSGVGGIFAGHERHGPGVWRSQRHQRSRVGPASGGFSGGKAQGR